MVLLRCSLDKNSTLKQRNKISINKFSQRFVFKKLCALTRLCNRGFLFGMFIVLFLRLTTELNANRALVLS